MLTADGMHPDKLASLRLDEINHSFYLPPDLPEVLESYADITKVTSIHTSYLAQARLVRRHRDSRIAALQMKLARYFGRPFGFNARDAVPRTAEYMCARCFFDRAEVHRMHYDERTRFGDCPRCGDGALWVRCPIV